MADGTCTVDGCDRPLRGPRTPYCQMHYSRARSGLPFDLPTRRRWYEPGHCEVEGCTRRPGSRFCQTHYSRWKKYGDPAIVHPGNRWPAGSGHPGWTGADATYGAVHRRLRAIRGAPKGCAHCSANDDRRYQWALDWDSVQDVRWGDCSGKTLPYSVKLDDYISLCLACHYAFDRRK